MRAILLFAFVLPVAALEHSSAASSNAVEVEKKRFTDTFRKQFPLWPESIKAQKKVKPLELRKPSTPRPSLRDAPNPKVPVPRSQAMVVAPGGPCAVPLVNAMRPGTPVPPMPKHRPDLGRFPFHDVQVPAPSCDDVKQR